MPGPDWIGNLAEERTASSVPKDGSPGGVGILIGGGYVGRIGLAGDNTLPCHLEALTFASASLTLAVLRCRRWANRSTSGDSSVLGMIRCPSFFGNSIWLSDVFGFDELPAVYSDVGETNIAMFAAILLFRVPLALEIRSSNPELTLAALYIELSSLGLDPDDSLVEPGWDIALV